MNKIKELKKELNISYIMLSKYVDIPDSGLIYLSNESRPFRQIHIEKLCSFFNITADYLLGKSDTGYIVYLENELDPVILSEEEYNRVKKDIDIKILQSANSESSFTIGGKTVYFPKFYVHRELKGNLIQYSFKGSITNKINKFLQTCSINELELILKFIEEFIKKKKL